MGLSPIAINHPLLAHLNKEVDFKPENSVQAFSFAFPARYNGVLYKGLRTTGIIACLNKALQTCCGNGFNE